jgi:hypothetical protein
MAKQSIVKVIKAKPGNRPPNYGKYERLPMICETNDCQNEAVVHYGKFAKRHKLCWHCFDPAEASAAKQRDKRKQAALDYLGSIGALAKLS